MTAQLAQKRLRVTLILSPQNSNGVFPGTNSNTLVLTGLRMLANVQTVPGSVSTHMDLKIFGMKQQDMNALTTIFFNVGQGSIVFNQLILEQNSTGDPKSGWTQVFSGMILEAQPEYRGAPAAYMCFQAIVGYQHKITPVPPTSYKGTTAVADIVETLAGQMDYAFENDGVTATLTNPYFSGTYWDQLNAACTATGTNYVVAGDTLAIYPAANARTIPPMLSVAPQAGLIGYPTLEKFGIILTTYYNPALAAGGKVKVSKSDVPNANGVWCPFMVDHQLEGNVPDGLWQSVSQCIPVPA